MKNVSRLLPLLPGIALLTGCNQKVQKDNGQNSQKPNIIYIFADDLGIGDLSCYGATKVSTPHIDRLAGQGVQFTNAYATSATSTPSRFGLLTGMYPWRQENTGIAPGNSELIIDTACVTMADMLKEAGYATGVVGKWHLGLGPKGGTDFNDAHHPQRPKYRLRLRVHDSGYRRPCPLCIRRERTRGRTRPQRPDHCELRA